MRLAILLSVFAFLLMLGDCVSTYLCLTTYHPTIRAYEANPVSAWIFELIGMVPGLVAMAVAKTGGLALLIFISANSPHRLRYVVQAGLTLLVLTTAYVNYNNWSILHQLYQ